MFKLILKRLGRIFTILLMIFMLIVWIVVGFIVTYVLHIIHKLRRGIKKNGLHV